MCESVIVIVMVMVMVIVIVIVCVCISISTFCHFICIYIDVASIPLDLFALHKNMCYTKKELQLD